MVQDAQAARSYVRVALEAEVHFFDAEPFRVGAEFGFGAGRAAAEENAIFSIHGMVNVSRHHAHLSFA
jgi:hypothetical protein